ncbi:MAG TPA: DUF429 domain-containing protein [Acidimicrobiales bacterium]|nr:DUF429 domain-containing protein [Acidimicrobiales bacterium]
MAVLGVDGCRQGWVGIVLHDDGVEGAVVGTSIAHVVRQAGDVAVVGIDIPIGLVAEGYRAPDLAARKVLGRRASTVFLTPPRAALEAATYAEALAVAGLSQQAWGLRHRIFEVEAWLPATDADVREVHPEVSFAEMAGAPLAAPKKTWAGAEQRRRLLARNGVEVPPELGAAGAVPVDDVLDAAAVAWTARRVAAGVARPLPDPPEDGYAIWA